MGFFNRLFGKKEAVKTKRFEQAVIVRFLYGKPDLAPLFELEKELEAIIAEAGAGEYDGNEVAVDLEDGSLWMYGPDADKLFAVVRPILEQTDVIHKAVATVRYGPPEDGVRSIEIRIGK